MNNEPLEREPIDRVRARLEALLEGLVRSRRANWKHGHFSREAKAERSRVRAAMLAVRYLRDSV